MLKLFQKSFFFPMKKIYREGKRGNILGIFPFVETFFFKINLIIHPDMYSNVHLVPIVLTHPSLVDAAHPW
jgi:hypothetical protein